MKGIMQRVKQILNEWKEVFQEYDRIKEEETHPSNEEGRTMIFMALILILPITAFIIVFRQQLLALLSVIALVVIPGFIFWLLYKSADLMDKVEPKQPVICYPVFRGFQPGSNYCQSAIVNEEFKEIAACFESCYFDHLTNNTTWNCAVYSFKIRPRIEMPLSYELIDLVQQLCEKKASVFFSECGLYRPYSDIVACTFFHDTLQIAFAYNQEGEAQIVKLRNYTYQQWHRKPPQNGGTASAAMSEEVPEIPPDKESTDSEDSKEGKN